MGGKQSSRVVENQILVDSLHISVCELVGFFSGGPRTVIVNPYFFILPH